MNVNDKKDENQSYQNYEYTSEYRVKINDPQNIGKKEAYDLLNDSKEARF